MLWGMINLYRLTNQMVHKVRIWFTLSSYNNEILVISFLDVLLFLFSVHFTDLSLYICWKWNKNHHTNWLFAPVG